VDVRVIAARIGIWNGHGRRRFRADLYYRLSVFPIGGAACASARRHPLLVWHFIQSRQRGLGKLIKDIPRRPWTAGHYDWRQRPGAAERHRPRSSSRRAHLRIEEALGIGGGARGARSVPARRRGAGVGERAHIIARLDRCGWASRALQAATASACDQHAAQSHAQARHPSPAQ